MHTRFNRGQRTLSVDIPSDKLNQVIKATIVSDIANSAEMISNLIVDLYEPVVFSARVAAFTNDCSNFISGIFLRYTLTICI